jgi:hypothetical protein
MAAATAVGGPDRVEAAASSAGAVLAVAVASQRLIGLLALAVSIIAVQFDMSPDNHVILLPSPFGLSTHYPVIALLLELFF